MTTLIAPNTATLNLAVGDTFLVSKSATSEGTFNVVGVSGVVRDQGVFGNTTLNNKVYGPYPEATTLALSCAIGSLTYSQVVAGGGSGGGTETTNTVSSGGTITLGATTPGTPINYIISTTAAVVINVPTTNAGSPGGRVNIVDATGNPNVTIAATTGNIAGVATLSLFGSADAYNSYNLYDYGTGWALQ